MSEFELGSSRLQFNESITSKSISVSVLCTRLRSLQSELSKLNQQIQLSSLESIKKDLFTISDHKDKYVRILSSCCLSDILRLYAPDPPFTQPELLQIFKLFFKQLKNIGDPSNAYFSDYFYLLDSISTVKSVVLLCELNVDDLILDIFRDFFDIIKY
jgi:sister-chromatid-cohesion protein PDS5